MAKSKEKMLARQMRRGGESIREIAKKVGVAKSTVSLWCRDIILTENQVEALIARDVVGGYKGRMKAWEWHRREKQERKDKYHKLGYEKFTKLSGDNLFYVGLALYWSEGSKRDKRVLLTNSDPNLIRIYMRWLVECLQVKKDSLICRVAINVQHKCRKNEIENYWSTVTGIPLNQFTRTTFIHSLWKKKYENRTTYYGVLALHVRKSTNLHYLVEGGIDRLREFGNLMVQ